MQTLQVLNADAELYTASEQYITIDTDTREITIPDSQKLFGVKDDLKAERKYFRCKKVVGDNLDLSKHRLYINYMNANKETSAYLVDDVKVDGDYITFSWLLYRSVTKYIGNVSFIVCAKSSNNKGLLQTDWNTTLATGTVKEGLEVDTATTEEYPDVIEQILNRLDGVEGGQISDEQMQNAIKKYFTVNPQKLADMQPDSQHRTVTDAEKQKWNSNTGGTSITVDTALSSTSVNPVQNKIIKAELDKKANTTDLGVKKVTHTASDVNVTINSGEYHVFPTMTSLTITLGTVGTNEMFICGFEFVSGSTPTVLTLKGCTLSNSDDVTKGTYEVNILGTSAIVRLR